MEDARILELYFERNEAAVEETDRKYRPYCRAIARNILDSEEDAAECVNDAWLAAWNSIPPHRPEHLAAYLGKLTRRAALKKWRDSRAEKRGGGQVSLALEELADCLPDSAAVDEALLAKELSAALNDFLAGLPGPARQVFVRRYWFLDPVETIAREMGFTRSKAASMLHRTRIRLREYLSKEGLL